MIFGGVVFVLSSLLFVEFVNGEPSDADVVVVEEDNELLGYIVADRRGARSRRC